MLSQGCGHLLLRCARGTSEAGLRGGAGAGPGSSGATSSGILSESLEMDLGRGYKWPGGSMDLTESLAGRTHVGLAARYQLKRRRPLAFVPADLRCHAVLPCTGEPEVRQATLHVHGVYALLNQNFFVVRNSADVSKLRMPCKSWAQSERLALATFLHT